MTSVKEKIISVIAGIILSLIMLEAGLRMYGAFAENRVSVRAQPAHSTYTILCLGDSFTYGLGVSSDKSYPSQLADMLKKGIPGKNMLSSMRGNRGETLLKSSMGCLRT